MSVSLADVLVVALLRNGCRGRDRAAERVVGSQISGNNILETPQSKRAISCAKSIYFNSSNPGRRMERHGGLRKSRQLLAERQMDVSLVTV